jgi:hypothetical protein
MRLLPVSNLENRTYGQIGIFRYRLPYKVARRAACVPLGPFTFCDAETESLLHASAENYTYTQIFTLIPGGSPVDLEYSERGEVCRMTLSLSLRRLNLWLDP